MSPEDRSRAALTPTCKEAGGEGVFQDDMAVTSKLSLSQAVDPTLSQLEAQERSSLESRSQRSEFAQGRRLSGGCLLSPGCSPVVTNGRISFPFFMAK